MSPLHVVVIGGSVTGLGAATALSKRGFRVTVFEKDATPMPASHVDAFEKWDRRGSPQTKHSHAFLARLYNLIREQVPELRDRLLACGASELRFADMARQAFDEPELESGDDKMTLLACRRITFEYLLREYVIGTGRVEFRDGVEVEHLLADPGAGGSAPHVRGVAIRTHDGARQEVAADLVLDASGRRTRMSSWLEKLGLPPLREEAEPCGIFYTSRFYRLHDGVEPPVVEGGMGADLGYMKYGIFPGDAGIFSLTLAAAPDDPTLRKVLKSAEAFEAAARAMPALVPWLDSATSQPVSEVHSMGNLRNVRRFLVEDGAPLVTGFFPIGDAMVHQNPMTGRGCSLGWISAFAAAELLDEHGTDAHAFALALDGFVEREVVPWYEAQRRADRDAIAVSQAEAAGEDPYQVEQPDGTQDPKAFMRSLLRFGIGPAMRDDIYVMRAFMRAMNLLQAPADLMKDPRIMQAALAAYEQRHERPLPVRGPSRAEMIEILERVAA